MVVYISKSVIMKNKVLFLILLLLQFYELIIFTAHFWYYVLTFLLAYFLINGYKYKSAVKKYIALYCLFIFVSAVSSSIFNKQPVLGTFVESYPYLGLLSFFLLPSLNIRQSKLIEQGMVKLAILFCVCYLIQYVFFPTIIFTGASTTGLFEDGAVRIRMAGSALSFFLYLWGLSTFLEKREKKYIFISLLALLVPFMMGFRSLLFLVVVCTVILIIKKEGFSFKIVLYGALMIILGFAVSFLPFVRDKIDSMIERQGSGQTFSNSDYIRFIEYDYYMENVFSNPLERFFGGGTPVYGTAYYNEIMVAFEKLLYWNDWGIIGLSWIIGVVPVCILIFLVLKCCLYHLNGHYFYLKLLLLLLLLGSIATSMEIYRNGNLIIVGLIMYLMEQNKYENLSNK